MLAFLGIITLIFGIGALYFFSFFTKDAIFAVLGVLDIIVGAYFLRLHYKNKKLKNCR